jgi:hypothetical protein
VWILAISCTQAATQGGIFASRKGPELEHAGFPFGIGCPDGWGYRTYVNERAGGFMRFKPPDPLPGGIDSFIHVSWGPTQADTTKVPETSREFVRYAQEYYSVQDGDTHVGTWDGEPAFSVRGRIKDEALLSDDAESWDDTHSLDGFMAGVRTEEGPWLTFLIASYPAGVYAEAFAEAVAGFRPRVDLGYEPRALPGGRCDGSFSPVSPPPYQEIGSVIVTFHGSPTSEATGAVTCQPRPPGETECDLLDAIWAVARVSARGYQIDIRPTASDEAVAEVIARLEHSPHVAGFKIEERDPVGRSAR